MIKRKIQRTKKPSGNTPLHSKFKQARLAHTYDGMLFDISAANNFTPTINGTGGAFYTKYGMRGFKTDTGGYLEYGNPPALALTESDSVTFLSVFSLSGSGARTLFRDDDLNIIWRINASNNLSFLWGNTATTPVNVVGSMSLSNDTLYAMAITRNVGGQVYASINGIEDLDTPDTLVGTFTANTSVWQSQNSGGGERFNGIRFLDTVLPFGMSKAEIISLTKNPYQLFQPRTQYIPTYIAPVGGFQSGWALASRRSGLIGAR